MVAFPFQISKSFLGIDIGTSSVKLIELSKVGSRLKLENYGEIGASTFYEGPFRTFEKNTLLLSTTDVAKAILAIIDEAKIQTKNVIFSIPDFSSFFTNFELPPMSQNELDQAVRFAARQHIPLPLGEVTIDWQVIKGRIIGKKGTKLRVLLVAVPNEVIAQYQEISNLTNLQFRAMEAETFGLVRSLVHDSAKLRIIIDIGAQSTTVTVVDGKVLQISHSLDVAGNEFTRVLSKSLNVDYREAELMKRMKENDKTVKKVSDIITPLVDLIMAETWKIAEEYKEVESKEIEEIIIAGGSANLVGIKEKWYEKFKKEIIIANPFSPLFYPPILEEALREMGPSYAVAVGMAERGLEQL